MKKYHTLGELLSDYRKFFSLSQNEFANKVNADIRTVQRWEKDETNVKLDKEVEFARLTLLPFQLIRNLNSSDTIPTFYDFRIRKYSLTELSNKIPDALWFKMHMDESTNRIRTINVDRDYEYISAFANMLERDKKSMYPVLKEAINLVPELNVILNDDAGSYAGFSINLPIKQEVFERLKQKELKKEDIKVNDLVNYKFQKNPVFFEVQITADCNDNIHFIVAHMLSFFKNMRTKKYIYCACTNRYDSYKLQEQLGLKTVWDESGNEKNNTDELPDRFVEGNFTSFLS